MRHPRSFVFDVATGQQVFRSTVSRILHRRTESALRWCAEVAGVGLIAVGAAHIHPAPALFIIGLYAILIANISE